ncbi:MAG: hypothetical protein FP816_15705 [Desulfobacteraceae bacterium]|nr:hypothetical protein [Desulfobacteraceae bacterium]MBU3948965.1 hypothetical protein [Pseudomonadota bacterium]MBU4010656.1 hypothetical protein [Pseudomonadota bacterium]
MEDNKLWEGIAEENGWPNPILLKEADKDRLPGFPYSRGGFRNMVTGKTRDEAIASKIFHVGRSPAVLRTHLVGWLNSRTKC